MSLDAAFILVIFTQSPEGVLYIFGIQFYGMKNIKMHENRADYLPAGSLSTLVRDPFGDRNRANPPWLGANDFAARPCPRVVQDELGHLRGLPATRLARDEAHLTHNPERVTTINIFF